MGTRDKAYHMLKAVLSVWCIMLVALPFFEVYKWEETAMASWEHSYIFDGADGILICFPLIILWFSGYFMKSTLMRKINAVILPLLSIPSFYIGVQVICFPIQGVLPGYGAYVALLLLPLLVLHFFLTFLVED